MEVVRNGEKPSCSGEEGLKALVLCEAVRAMRTGLPMDIRGFEIVEENGSTAKL